MYMVYDYIYIRRVIQGYVGLPAVMEVSDSGESPHRNKEIATRGPEFEKPTCWKGRPHSRVHEHGDDRNPSLPWRFRAITPRIDLYVLPTQIDLPLFKAP